MFIKREKIKSSKEQRKDWADIQQPIDPKSGKVNNNFDKLYSHKTQNPFHGTELDPNRTRQERVKIETEYQRYQNQMKPSEQLKYERNIRELRVKETRR